MLSLSFLSICMSTFLVSLVVSVLCPSTHHLFGGSMVISVPLLLPPISFLSSLVIFLFQLICGLKCGHSPASGDMKGKNTGRKRRLRRDAM